MYTMNIYAHPMQEGKNEIPELWLDVKNKYTNLTINIEIELNAIDKQKSIDSDLWKASLRWLEEMNIYKLALFPIRQYILDQKQSHQQWNH